VRRSTRQASVDVLAGGVQQCAHGPRPDVVHGLLPGPRIEGQRRLSLPAVVLDERGEAVGYLVHVLDDSAVGTPRVAIADA